MEILALADDLTGALEVGARLGGALVTTRRDFAGTPRVLVIDTETRHLPPGEAAGIVARCARPARVIYKKTDSTLRGNIASELGALAGMFPERAVHYAGAYPALGRTVRDGLLYVDGVPVDETAFADDSLNPVRDSSIRRLLGDIDCRIWDGETDGDVSRAVRAIASGAPVIIAGPAAVAANLANQAPSFEIPRLTRCAILNGSLHPTSARQIEAARGCLPRTWRVIEWRDRSMLRDMLRDAECDGVFVSGGDTAFELAGLLGVSEFRPLGEVLPGVPISRMRGPQGYLITKAGGYGGDDLLVRLQGILNGS